MSILYNSPNCGEIELLMTEAEPSYIFSRVPENGTLVEWGCGGSTVFFLDNLKENQYFITIEHNKAWYDKMVDRVKDHPNRNRHVFLFIPPHEISNNYYARPEEEMPCGLGEYICPDMDIITTADVFLVDGIARGPIAAFLSRKVKSGAEVIIHDYKGRENWYDWAVACYDYYKQPEDMVLVHMANSQL